MADEDKGIWWKDVFSSNVIQVGYDGQRKDLLVKWSKGGKTSAYHGVPEELALQLANAPSVGSMLNEEIKPFFSHRYV